MAQGNVEIVRRILLEWEQGNFGGVQESFDPALHFETFMPDASENVVTRGIPEFQAFGRDWLAQWRNYRIVAEEFEEIGDDKVFVAVRQLAEGRRSGVQVDSAGYAVWTLRDGRVVALSLHYDREDARRVAGH